MRYLITLLVATFLCCSCQTNEDAGVPVLNLSALAALPLDKPIDSLAKGSAFIDVKLPEGAMIAALPQSDLALLKAAAYRFFTHVRLVDNQYVVDLKDAEEIHVSSKIFSSYMQAIAETNAYADSLQQVGQEIRLPEVTAAYRDALLQ